MKKIISILYFAAVCTFLAFTQSAYNSNLLSTTAFNASEINDIFINVTFEEIEFSEIYGSEIVIDIYGNNNILLPEIINDKEKRSLNISSSEKSKKPTAGDICKIAVYIPAESFFNNFSIEFTNKQIINIGNIAANNINIFDKTPPANSSNIFIQNVKGNLKAVSSTGNINIKNYQGEYFSAVTKTGNISCSNITADYFDLKSNTGHISIALDNFPSGSSLISSKTGNVQFFIPTNSYIKAGQEDQADSDDNGTNTGFNLNIHSTNGTFFNKLENKRFSPRQGYEESFNGGGAVISIETVTGNIEVDEY